MQIIRKWYAITFRLSTAEPVKKMTSRIQLLGAAPLVSLLVKFARYTRQKIVKSGTRPYDYGIDPLKRWITLLKTMDGGSRSAEGC